ncbi:MAG: RidA family protein [Coxiellaceae bacterium]|nr:RidA family protein [Coxiellaceae bacterium]
MKTIISTDSAPAAVGTYSQAVKAGNTVYMSGQVPLDPATMKVVDGDFKAQTKQVFENLKAVAEAAGGSLADIVKLNVFIVDMAVFPQVSEVMGDYFEEPYPARACVAVAALPLGVPVEMEAVMVLAE